MSKKEVNTATLSILEGALAFVCPTTQQAVQRRVEAAERQSQGFSQEVHSAEQIALIRKV